MTIFGHAFGDKFLQTIANILNEKKDLKILLQDMEEMNLQSFFLNVMKMEL